MKRSLLAIVISWFTFVAIPSIPRVRAILAAPLVVTDEGAKGDACYVMAAGKAFWERLDTASDLYHMKRIPKIYLMQNSESYGYDFSTGTNPNQTQLAIDFLIRKGVSKERVIVVPEVKGLMGTLPEARNMAAILPKDIKKLVLVTSAPHTRRSLFAFRRLFPASVTVVPYAATPIETSSELYAPIWLEYLKLLVYRIYLFS